MRENKLIRILEAGGTALGASMGFHSPDTVELLGVLGIDYVLFDMEHEPYDELSLLHSLRAAEGVGLTTICRVPNDANLVLRVLDAGAQGIHVPRINTTDEVRAVVDAARFRPVGDRSFFATARSGDYGLGVTEEEFADRSNAETLVIVQIEEVQAVEQISELLAVPGVDAMQVGPKDLWQSMGMPADRSQVLAVADRAIGTARDAGKYVSSYVWMNETFDAQVDRLTERGVQMLTASARDFIVDGARRFLALRERLS